MKTEKRHYYEMYRNSEVDTLRENVCTINYQLKYVFKSNDWTILLHFIFFIVSMFTIVSIYREYNPLYGLNVGITEIVLLCNIVIWVSFARIDARLNNKRIELFAERSAIESIMLERSGYFDNPEAEDDGSHFEWVRSQLNSPHTK